MKVFENFDGAKLSWFKAGGKIDVFAIVDTKEELLDVLDKYDNGKVMTVGAGSNLLIRDSGFHGLIIKLGQGFNRTAVEVAEESETHKILVAGASTPSSAVVQFAIRNNLVGAEFMSTIPGSIGGMTRMNAGCFGKEVKDIFYSTNVLRRVGTWQEQVDNLAEMQFAYRHSALNSEDIVIETRFLLKCGTAEDVEKSKQEIAEMQAHRKQNQVVGMTCGSTFANPDGYSAWRLIASVGLRGHNINGAVFSEKHCNFIVNTGGASATDIENLIDLAKQKVKAEHGIDLRTEICIVGEKK